MRSVLAQVPPPILLAFLTAVVAIICATVAVCLGKIDASAYGILVSSLAGVGVGAGVHSVAVGAAPAASDDGGGR